MSTDTENRVSAQLPADLPTGLLINGEWTDSSTGGRISVTDPSTGEELTSIADASADDAVAALDAAAAAQAEWAATAPRTRGEILRKTFDEVTRRKDDFARLMTMEMGKPLAEAYGEVTYGSEFLRWFSEEAVRINGRYGLNPEGTGRMVVSSRPVGPAYLITPWNFPLAMATRKIAPALAAGCPVIIKPAANTPLTTLLLAQVLIDAGVPAGVVNVIASSDSAGVTKPLLSDPRLRKLSFTGSTPVGRRLLAQAAENILRTSMELGGNAPFLIFDDADLDAAVDGAMIAKFRNIGQACTAANRFIVHSSLAEEFVARVTERVRAMKIGSGLADGVNIGPLIDGKAVSGTEELVADAVDRGARVTTGGERVDGPGFFYQPTVLSDVAPGTRLLHEEIFGPVLGVTTFDTEEEGVAAANDTEYGLVSYAYTRDLARAHRLIDSLETGMMGLNTGLVSNAAAPFGGVKASGLGREGSQEGIEEYLETKYTLIPA
ncbi:NAD-dependent succinate-semialdehyde dehydrogenase [Microlunatus ginsengisoli]|uniref:NAD-dependent succinate-semialdehyde dehydrogenase n=1 Tax=Microlunatus ginsengisoli TaxID=363863 RepID=A0ABP6ZJL2_9ACTN